MAGLFAGEISLYSVECQACTTTTSGLGFQSKIRNNEFDGLTCVEKLKMNTPSLVIVQVLANLNHI